MDSLGGTTVRERAKRTLLGALPLAMIVATLGCAEAGQPHISAIDPPSGPAGAAYPLQAVIHGDGFAPTGNVVAFGPVRIPDLPSADGQTITFQIPKEMDSGGEVPPVVFPPGDYDVTVTTASSASNAVAFTLTR